MDLRGPSMTNPQPRAAGKPRHSKRRFKLREKFLIGAVVTALLGGGATAAFATTSGQVCTTSSDNVTICHDGGSATSTDKVTATATNKSKSTTKVTLANFSSTAKTGLKPLKVTTFCIGMKKTAKTHRAFVVTKADTSKKCKFTNQGKTTAGKAYLFRDYVGSIDSKPGTISATFYWSHEKVKGKWVWQLRKGNCKNPINQAQTTHSVTKVTMVSKWTVDTKLAVNAASKAMISAHAECKVGGSIATADSKAQATGSATASVTGHGSGSTLAIATANSKADAKKKADALRASTEQKAILDAQTDVETTASVTADAKVECKESTVTPPPSSSTPPASTTPPVTTPPVTTPPVTTPPATTTPPTPKAIQVCELSTKKIVSITEDKFDSSKYSKNLDDCKVTPPPVPVKIQVCELATKKIVSINESDFNASKYSKNLDDCKVTPPPAPQKPTVTIEDMNDQIVSTTTPGIKVHYSVWGTDKALIHVESVYGSIPAWSDTTVSGSDTNGGTAVTFTYKAPGETAGLTGKQWADGPFKGIPLAAGYDRIWVTITDTTSNLDTVVYFTDVKVKTASAPK